MSGEGQVKTENEETNQVRDLGEECSGWRNWRVKTLGIGIMLTLFQEQHGDLYG